SACLFAIRQALNRAIPVPRTDEPRCRAVCSAENNRYCFLSQPARNVPPSLRLSRQTTHAQVPASDFRSPAPALCANLPAAILPRSRQAPPNFSLRLDRQLARGRPQLPPPTAFHETGTVGLRMWR